MPIAEKNWTCCIELSTVAHKPFALRLTDFVAAEAVLPALIAVLCMQIKLISAGVRCRGNWQMNYELRNS